METFIIRIYLAGLILLFEPGAENVAILLDDRNPDQWVTKAHDPVIGWGWGTCTIKTEIAVAEGADYETIMFQLTGAEVKKDATPVRHELPSGSAHARSLDWIPSLTELIPGVNFESTCKPPNACADKVVAHVELSSVAGDLSTCRLVGVKGDKIAPVTFVFSEVRQAASEMLVLELEIPIDSSKPNPTFNILRKIYDGGSMTSQTESFTLDPAKCVDLNGVRRCLEIAITNISRETGRNPVGYHFQRFYGLLEAGDLLPAPPLPIIVHGSPTVPAAGHQPDCAPNFALPNIGDRPICPLSQYP